MHILSTVTTPITFAEYTPFQKNRTPRVVNKVMIRGGANLPAKTLVTPRGVLTPVTSEQLDFLKNHPKFQKAVRDGFMQVLADERDLDAAVKGMTPKDKSAPKVASDFAKPPKAQAAA